MTSALALTFHGLRRETVIYEASRDPATERYVVPAKRFEEAVREIPPEVCCTASEFVHKKEGNWLILTFDDGFISDFEVTFPVLMDKGLKASFFVTAENVGRPGYTSIRHLKEMAQAGMEIASHGLTHNYLVTMPYAEAIREIRESKERLEKEIGVEVTSFAPVGGHYHKWMLEVAREVDYKAFATMIPGRTFGNKDMVMLRRNHIQAHHDAAYVSWLLNGDGRTLIFNRLRYHLLQVPKVILGMQNYDRAKEFFFKHKYRPIT